MCQRKTFHAAMACIDDLQSVGPALQLSPRLDAAVRVEPALNGAAYDRNETSFSHMSPWNGRRFLAEQRLTLTAWAIEIFRGSHRRRTTRGGSLRFAKADIQVLNRLRRGIVFATAHYAPTPRRV